MTGPGSPPQPAASPPQQALDPKQVSRFAGPGDALKALVDDFNYWSANLTDSSFALSLSLIGANWAVFGSVTSLQQNLWAKLSIFFVILSLVASLGGAWYMADLHRKQYTYAESDTNRWRQEFTAAQDTVDPWPVTSRIENVGKVLRILRLLLPLLAGLIFLLGLFLTSAPVVPPRAAG
jgi:hypothetical protein